MRDLISRKDAIELLKNDMENNGLPLYDDYNIGINHAMCLLACVPTAEPKVGKWIRITQGLIVEKYACSVCGRIIEDGESGALLFVKYPYCHCGAKMERSE